MSGSIADLEKEVANLQKKLKEETDKTQEVQKQVKDLQKEVKSLRDEVSSDSPVSNGARKPALKKVESDSSSESEEEPKKTDKKSVTVVDPNKPIVKAGFLEKKGALRHNWLPRYFELDGVNHFLNYYEKKGDKELIVSFKPKGVIPLTNATCFAHVEKKGVVKPYFFNIRTETRDFLLKAQSKEDKDAWVTLIKEFCVKGTLSPEGKRHLQKKASSFIGKTTDEVEAKKNKNK